MNRTELYSENALSALHKRNKTRRIALTAFALAALAVCVFLCFRVNTENAGRLELAVIAISTVCGWIYIYFRAFSLGAGKREEQHARNMLAGTPEAYEGTLTISDTAVRVPGSIRVYHASLAGEDGEKALLLNAEKRDLLPKKPQFLRVYAVNSYIAAYEDKA